MSENIKITKKKLQYTSLSVLKQFQHKQYKSIQIKEFSAYALLKHELFESRDGLGFWSASLILGTCETEEIRTSFFVVNLTGYVSLKDNPCILRGHFEIFWLFKTGEKILA